MVDLILKLYYTYRYFQTKKSKLIWLYKTGAPFSVYVCDYLTYLKRKEVKLLAEKVNEFLEKCRSKQFSTDWFSNSIPQWIMAFKKVNVDFNKPIHALEIGSFEGMSAMFILENFQNAQLTCVDTWEGSDEHHTKNSSFYIEDFSNFIENKFDKNLNNYQERLTKYRGYSFNFLASIDKDISFDLIYIDGSHNSEDVIFDTFLGYKHLNNGGIMIFDDYFWRDFYKKPLDNPAAAINTFLKLKEGQYKLIAVYDQLIIQKL